MVMLGYEDTISVTMEDMIHHTAAVARGAENALIVADMPFMSYQTSVYDGLQPGRLMKEGRCQAVKLGGRPQRVSADSRDHRGICSGYGAYRADSQSVNAFGGFKVQGKTEEAARRLLQEAKAVEEAGAFAVVLECVPAKLSALISKEISIPTIGIGAGAGCDGQILVYQDMLAMYSDFTPKFVKKYADIGKAMQEESRLISTEVRKALFLRRNTSLKFPTR